MNHWKRIVLIVLIIASILRAEVPLPEYERVTGVSGTLTSVGSDTLNNLMQLWIEGFREIYPNVREQLQSGGSSTAPAALLAGSAQIGPMSRLMTRGEMDQFEARYGYPPTAVPVAIDTLAVFVHRDNPLPGLTLAQIDAIFSNTYVRGHAPILTWGDAGLSGEWAPIQISLYGRNTASGTYGFFKEEALRNGDFHPTRYQEVAGSSTVVSSVGSDRFGIGYSGIGYTAASSDVRIVPIAEVAGEEFVMPTQEAALSGDYPLARFLYVYVNKHPNRPLDTLTLEFLKFVNSRQGQEAAVRGGYFPLPGDVAEETIQELSQ